MTNNIDLSYMELMTDGDVEMKKVMIEMLLDEPEGELIKMVALADGEDLATLKSISHKMKSTLSFVGNKEMTTKNAKIELISDGGGDIAELAELTARLVEIFQYVKKELQQVLETL